MIYVIGIGLDGAQGLTAKSLSIIETSTVLVGSDRQISYFPDYSGEKLKLGNLNQIVEKLEPKIKEQQKIVILASGDPLFFGLGRLLLEKFSAEQLTFCPHLSSVQLAFNHLKLTWHDAEVISVHGRSMELLIPLLQKGINKLAILTDQDNNPAAIARFCSALALPIQYQFWVCEDLGADQEKIKAYDSEELKDYPESYFSPLNILILLRQEANQTKQIEIEKLPLFGIPDSEFISFADRPGLMTKREIRVQALAELALQPQQTIWDIGAGTGSVSIEIARLCPSSQIYAIEKTAIGVTLIERNCQRFQTKNITFINGIAPGVLNDLPNPDRIFMGGSGGNLEAILNLCQRRLNPEGKIVLALATLEHLMTVFDCLKNSKWNFTVQHLQISRSLPFANLTRFQPLNPIYLITTENFLTKQK